MRKSLFTPYYAIEHNIFEILELKLKFSFLYSVQGSIILII